MKQLERSNQKESDLMKTIEKLENNSFSRDLAITQVDGGIQDLSSGRSKHE